MSKRSKKSHVKLNPSRAKQLGRLLLSKNGKKNEDPKSLIEAPVGVPTQLARILRPQAAYRWLLPSLASMTPQFIETILRGALMGNHGQQWELFDLMLDTWPELSACHGELLDGVLRRKMIFESFHEEDEQPTSNAIERMKIISSALKGMKPLADQDENALEGTVRDIIDGWFRGISVIEIIWQVLQTTNGPLVAPRSTAWVHPAYYAFDQFGTLGLRVNDSAPQYSVMTQPRPDTIQPFPPYKFLISIHKARSGTALGGALLRPLAWWWCAANFSSDWLLNLAQVFGLPFRWANYATAAPQATIDAICNMLQNMGSAGWAAFPEGTTLELKEAASSSRSARSPQDSLLDRADRYARMLILGQTMTGATMSTGKGGQAFGETEVDVKHDRIDAVARFACEILNRQLIPAILSLNYGDDSEAPEVRFLEDKEGGLEDAQRDSTLAKMGMQIPASYLQKKYDVPEAAEGEKIVTPPQNSGSMEPDNQDKENLKKIGSAPGKIESRIAHLFSIDDDAVFAKELASIADEIKKS